ncbi:Uncharacterised protein [Mycobacterium tuberculosis]|nr:Uncharacterised protein [Mycobacterium tuberculosis]CKP43875.1 Uncharacterised protein [Mycobacterium tuberculosis]CKR89173.1 Uncharacterised protein [Mycobacterium tuberculosis]
MAHALRAHHVTGVEPTVAISKSVAHQLLFAGNRVGVAVERLQPVDPAKQQAGFTVGYPTHSPARIPQRIAGVQVVFHKGKRHRRYPGGPGHVEDVDKGRVAFAGGVELAHPRDPEAGGELIPDLRPQPVTADHPHLVGTVGRLGRLVEQITADFADVDERRRPVGNHLIPEPRRRKRLTQRQGRPRIDHRRHRDR